MWFRLVYCRVGNEHRYDTDLVWSMRCLPGSYRESIVGRWVSKVSFLVLVPYMIKEKKRLTRIVHEWRGRKQPEIMFVAARIQQSCHSDAWIVVVVEQSPAVYQGALGRSIGPSLSSFIRPSPFFFSTMKLFGRRRPSALTPQSLAIFSRQHMAPENLNLRFSCTFSLRLG